MKLIYCKRCFHYAIPTVEADENHIAKCANCGKHWQLTDDNRAIKTVVLEVQDSTLGASSEFEEEKGNG